MDEKTQNSGVQLKYVTHSDAPRKTRRRVTKMSRKRYRKSHAAVIALVALFLAVIAFSVILIIRNEKNDPRDSVATGSESETFEATESSTDTASAPESAAETEAKIKRDPAEVLTLTSADLHDGNLILVNNNFAYVFPTEDILLEMKPKAEHFLVSTIDTSLRAEALDAFVALTNGLFDASGCGDVLVVSSFRGEEKQREIYQDRVDRYGAEYAAAYVANPGYSEHHTGLAMDLTVYTDGASYDIESYEGTEWFMENYDKYGYVLRYPEEKADITGINYEGWHYRYVGLPHSLIMDSLDLCLEEYILDFLPLHKSDSAVCCDTATGAIKYVDAFNYDKSATESIVYYVPSTGDATSVKISAVPYEVSGDNVGGFVVTIK